MDVMTAHTPAMPVDDQQQRDGGFSRYQTLLVALLAFVQFTIIPDLVPLQLRGRVMGFVQTAFAASQVLGIPAGLFLSNHWSWQVSFGALVALSVAGMAAVWFVMRPVNAHLLLKQDKTAFRHL